MSDPTLIPIESPDPVHETEPFSAGSSHTPNAKERDWRPWIVALVAVAVVAGLALLLGRQDARSRATGAGVDPYATNLIFSNVHVSQASNFAGDQLTYVDGTVTNRGNKLVTSVMVRVMFPNDVGEPPQAKQLPLSLIRMTEPYVDTESVSAAPLKSGSSRDFRLIFDDVSSLWNQHPPAVQAQILTVH